MWNVEKKAVKYLALLNLKNHNLFNTSTNIL